MTHSHLWRSWCQSFVYFMKIQTVVYLCVMCWSCSPSALSALNSSNPDPWCLDHITLSWVAQSLRHSRNLLLRKCWTYELPASSSSPRMVTRIKINHVKKPEQTSPNNVFYSFLKRTQIFHSFSETLMQGFVCITQLLKLTVVPRQRFLPSCEPSPKALD